MIVKSDTHKNKELSLYQALIRRGGQHRYRGIHNFRESFPETLYFSSFKTLFPLKTSLQDFHGNPFPKVAEQIFANKAPKALVSPFREILWGIARCLKFTEPLAEFLKLRRNFEIAALTNDRQEAMKILAEIDEKFGKSIWWYQNCIASAYIGNTECEPAETADRIEGEVQQNSVLSALISFIRKRIQGATLRDKLIQELNERIKSRVILDYFLAKILNITDSSDEAVSSLLFVDAQASIIDHYDSLIFALQAAVSDDKLTDEMACVLLPALKRLHSHTRDQRLIGILVSLGEIHILPVTELARMFHKPHLVSRSHS